MFLSDALKQAMSEYRKPQQILIDQGVQFYTWQEGGKTRFTKYLERNGIQHIVASKRRIHNNRKGGTIPWFL